MMETLVVLGLVNWLGTLLVTESEFFRPVRHWIERRADAAYLGPEAKDFAEAHKRAVRRLTLRHRARVAFWDKVDYLVHCALCAGVWVGAAIAAVVPDFRVAGTGVTGFVLTALAIKAVGRVTLTVQHRVAR